ncbi:hypothetical protein [Corallococcus interemptor]|uniref:hypothetical protein n=1 Tax=Corallococcus interemptor TaxID=2316720 RepID=UPI0011C44C7A|nr:hypothetical protein [Corallococcus interemptor]
MPTTNQALDNLRSMQESIEGKLRRSIDHPGFAARLMETVARIRAGSRLTLNRAHELSNELQRPLTEARDKANLQLNELHQEYQKLQQTVNFITEQPERANAQRRIRDLEQEISHRANEVNLLNSKSNVDIAEFLERETDAFDSLINTMYAYLDETSALLRGLDATEKVREIAKADFATKSASFQEAASFHRRQATGMLVSMAIIISAIALGIYKLFIQWPALPTPSSTGSHAQIPVDQIALLVTGRIAFLFLAGWALKYVADLHRSHAEQAVIYRDRNAALGIAEAMLAASPGDEQQRELLKMLADGYLNFEQSAFRRHHKLETKEPAIDVQIKRLKDAVDAVRPLLDPVVKAAEKAK